MEGDLKDSFFTQHSRHFSGQNIKKTASIPFKDHPQFAILVDILIRKYTHHAIITTGFSAKMYPAFIEALLHHFMLEHIPYHLRGAELIYIDAQSKSKLKSIEKDFIALRETLDNSDKLVLIVFSSADLFIRDTNPSDEEAFLRRQLESLLAHTKCRFLILANENEYQEHRYLNEHFDLLHVNGPTEADVMTILKQQRAELEEYHRLLIPEELLSMAYSLSERYLSTDNTLEKTLLLLDSSAARACAIERIDGVSQFKPVLTSSVIFNVLSGWTQIPPSQLQLNKFRLNDFIQGMQQKVFGQNTAITMIGHALQQAQAHLQQRNGPFCSFLFAGTEHAGKETVALALVEQLFKQLNVLYLAQPAAPTLTSITDLKVQRCLDKQYLTIKEVIQQTPYAVIMIENVDQVSPVVLDGLQEILTTGFLHDTAGNQYNFCQSIIVLSTTLGASRMADISKPAAPVDDFYSIDLMQLVMSEQQRQEAPTEGQHTPQELLEKIMPDISANLPAVVYQHLHIVPFIPLSKVAIEKIIRLKLKVLSRQLDKMYNIELGYAPEIINFLTNDVLGKQRTNNQYQTVDMDKALKPLYFSIEQIILSQADNKNRPNQLYLQLNETGQALRCDWLSMTDVRQHAN